MMGGTIMKKLNIPKDMTRKCDLVMSNVTNLDAESVLKIVRSASEKDIRFLDIGVRSFVIEAQPIKAGYDKLFYDDEVIINAKTKIIEEKAEPLSMREANVTYEIIIPYTSMWNYVCTLSAFASAQTTRGNENALKYYTFLIAKSIFDSDEFLNNIHRFDIEERLEKFFPVNMESLHNVRKTMFDVTLIEQTSNKNKKEKYDFNVRNEITLDESLNVRNLHQEKPKFRRSFSISTFIRGIGNE